MDLNFNYQEWQRQDFSLRYIIKQTSNNNREKCQLGDYHYLIQYKILQTNIIRIVQQIVRRITYEILGVKWLTACFTDGIITGIYSTFAKIKEVINLLFLNNHK